MRVTARGQVTIPLSVREKLGIHPGDEVEFTVTDGEARLVKRPQAGRRDRWCRLRGVATVRMSTDEIMALTRGTE